MTHADSPVNTVIYANLGITSVEKQLAYNLMTSVLSAIVALVAVSQSDKMPRRKVLIIGTFLCAIWLAINSGLSAVLAKQGDNINKSVGQAALAAYFMFGFTFTFAYTPLQGVIPAEALETVSHRARRAVPADLPQSMRAKGLAASGIIVSAIGFINQFAGPIGLQNLGYKYIYIFVAWDLIESALWYFFCVESQGRTLEELAWVYDQPNPVKASLTIDKVVIAADGRVEEKIES